MITDFQIVDARAEFRCPHMESNPERWQPVLAASSLPVPAARPPAPSKHADYAPDFQVKWDGVAKAMRENAASMDKLVQEKQGKMANMNAVDDLKTYQEFSQANLDGLKNLSTAFKTLYDSMPADQKKIADGVFDSYGPKPAQRG